MRIVESDNFDGDYPDEKFVNIPFVHGHAAEEIAAVINKHCSGNHAHRYWKVVPNDYKLAPGFTP